MARYLMVGDLQSSPSLSFFTSHPEMEFLNAGSGQDINGLQKRPMTSILFDVSHNAYDLILFGRNSFPNFNPRKNWIRNIAGMAKKTADNPSILLTGIFFQHKRLATPFVGLDLEDSPIVHNSWFPILRKSVCFFKRELPQNPCNAFLYTSSKTESNTNVNNLDFFRDAVVKLRPISLGVHVDASKKIINVPKKTDVFFSGNFKGLFNREQGLKQLEALKKEGYAIDIAYDRLPRAEFLRRCAQAYIVWSPEGAGWDCFRHYEAAMVGSVPLMQTPAIYRYAPLVDGVHGLYYFIENDHFSICVRNALQNRPRLVEMGMAAKQHILIWHTRDALGHYVINETKKTLDNIKANKSC